MRSRIKARILVLKIGGENIERILKKCPVITGNDTGRDGQTISWYRKFL